MKKIQIGSAVIVKVVITSAGDNEILSGEDDTLEFVCGQNQIFEGVENAVIGLAVGEIAYVQLEPEEHVGDYDAELVRMEDRQGFPDNIEEGMLFEGLPNDNNGDETGKTTPPHDPEHAERIYLVTDVTDEVVVLDGNHPLAGMALKFQLTVVSIDAPTPIAETAEFAPNFDAIN
jgi:FKBP-type peptidyl-prolyl cis-trans isomerase SlyD